MLDAQVLTAGTMNRSRRVSAAGGTAAVKEVLDVDAVAARRQAAACQALAGRGLPVPAPLRTAAGDHLVELAGAVYTAAGWVSGGCRAGAELTLAETAGLGTLLAGVHDALGAELVRSATLIFAAAGGPGLDLPRVGAFVRGYRTRRALSDAAIADAVDRLWWDRACETWDLRLRYTCGDTCCDAFFRSVSGLVGWWTPRRDEVLEALVLCP